MHDFNSLIFVVGFCTPKSQRSKSASEQKKECRNLAPKPVSKPNDHANKKKKLMTSITPVLPTLGAQPPLSPEGHHFSEHLAPLEVTGGPKEHGACKAGFWWPQIRSSGVLLGAGQPKDVGCSGRDEGDCVPGPSLSGTLTYSSSLLCSQTCGFHQRKPSRLITRQQSHVISTHHR